ncbi:ATP-binding protein [Nocardioides marmorisolisilvae]|uniref:ATP-binding protein n=1 Tax=Nocardioides marmorisolisilvae TaxID=1542737 RepID=A0A3N0DPG4_9ACTN|nr:ATP-binding protein [Nocardioides marmorisolisilvae]RNL77540.1 ATP-binding protein [Nocardioides marmorisolisilvae]
MPWNKRTLPLPAGAPSVRMAREWVSGVLDEIGRTELAESARLAVSELVTNALLHAEPPMTVHVRGTVEHPRIEVTDQSMVPPQPRHSTPLVNADDELTWTTVGRGLDLVASFARRWGADIDPRGFGKVVWFEPAAEVRENPAEGELFDLDDAIAQRGEEPADPESMLTIELLGMPTELFSHLRLHFNELGRELRLLAITDPDRYPIAVEFAETYLQIEHERRQVVGLDDLDSAMDAHKDTVDLAYRVPATAPESMSRVAVLLEEIYRSFAQEKLLAVRPSPELMSLQRWYLGEFSRQANGHRPMPWVGPTRLVGRQEVS